MAPTHSTVEIRKVRPEDGTALANLIDALADYEKLTPPTSEAQERLRHDLFETKRIDSWLAWYEGKAVGYTIVCETYSSFLALPTLYLEDLFVKPEYRGKGVGRALFNEMREEAKRRGCGRMEWTVLDWNQLAIDFYERLGAERKGEWILYRITP
jgi:GNAT superfamily N-acetyltransferase